MPRFPQNMFAPIGRLIIDKLQSTAEIERDLLYQYCLGNPQIRAQIEQLATKKCKTTEDIASNLLDWFNNEVARKTALAQPWLEDWQQIQIQTKRHASWAYRRAINEECKQNIVVFNIAWMQQYQGLVHDSIANQSSFVQQEHLGYEIYNFLTIDDWVYGFVQPSNYRKAYLERQIHIEQIDPRFGSHADYLDDVLVLWLAPHPKGGTYLVGWYQHARVYRYYQRDERLIQRQYQGETLGYFVRAKASDAVCLPPSERTLSVQRASQAKRYAGGLGHSCVWYAKIDNTRPYNALFRAQVLEFIQAYRSDFYQAVQQSKLKNRAARLAKADKKPKHIAVKTWQFVRNPDVVAEVLERAQGVCERCGQPAPFSRQRDNSPYLEVHHKTPLAKGGDDTVDNAIALCPNCHRYYHHGI